MAPESRITELKAQHVDRKNAKKAGVMALFYPNSQGHTNLLLILRKTYIGVHSNQVAFPGGKAELEEIAEGKAKRAELTKENVSLFMGDLEQGLDENAE